MNPALPCQRCGRTPADATRPVKRKGKDEAEYYCHACWDFFSRVLTAVELEREERAKRMIEGAF